MRPLVLCSFFVAAATCCRADIILSLSPRTQNVLLGSQANFNLDIARLGPGKAVGTYDINLAFDSTLLAYDSIVFGNQVDILGLGDIQLVTPGTGTIEVFELSLDSATDLINLQAPSFTLASLTFDTLATGTNSPLTLSVNALGDAYGNSIAANFLNGSVTIDQASSTPEPGSAMLLSLGGAMLALVLMTRAKRQGSQAS